MTILLDPLARLAPETFPGMVHAPLLTGASGVRHAFFTRNANPAERFGDANVAYRTPAETAAVDARRARCAAALGARALITVKQRHTTDVVTVEKAWAWDEAPIADALVTRRPGLALGILTADCAPVLLADATAGVIGAAHAGWRGAVGGVVAQTVAAMTALGAEPARMVAVVGPCIAQASYEVGPEFRAEFLARDPGFERHFDMSRPRPHFDLAAFVADRLQAAGVGEVAVEGTDTFADEARLFSFRRATLRREPDYGRQISAIALDDHA